MRIRSPRSLSMAVLVAVLLPTASLAQGGPGNLGQCLKDGSVGTPRHPSSSGYSVGAAGDDWTAPAAYQTVGQAGASPNANPPVPLANTDLSPDPYPFGSYCPPAS